MVCLRAPVALLARWDREQSALYRERQLLHPGNFACLSNMLVLKLLSGFRPYSAVVLFDGGCYLELIKCNLFTFFD